MEWSNSAGAFETLVTAGARGLSELRLDSAPKPGDETVWWCEVRPDEGGRGVVCSQTTGGDVVSWTPDGFSARAKVHEYGGGSFCVGGGRVFFTNAQDQRLYAQDSPSGAPVALTPAGSGCRYADGDVGKGRLFVVEEDHSLVGGDVQYPANRLVSVSATPPPKGQEPGKPEAVASGADFYASPRLSPCGGRLTWLQWSFPRMPWEGTEVWVADVDETGKVRVWTERLSPCGGRLTWLQWSFPRMPWEGTEVWVADVDETVKVTAWTERLSPCGGRLTWLQWSFPRMPWEGTEVWVADVDETGKVRAVTVRLSPCGGRLTWLQWSFPRMPWEGTEVWVADVDETGKVRAWTERLSPCGGRLTWLQWSFPRMPWEGTEVWVADVDETGKVRAWTERLSPCGGRLTWLQWSFPRMPWEGTEVWVADVDETGKVRAWTERLSPCGGRLTWLQWSFPRMPWEGTEVWVADVDETGKVRAWTERLSPCGGRLTWLQWSFPRMPWEGTEVWVADVDETGKVSGGRKVAGDGVRSYVMPRLASADRLLVVHDATDWWNLYEIDVNSGEELRAVHPAAAETGEPCWQFGYQGFCAEAGGNRVALYSAGALHLTTRDGSQPARKLETGYTGHRHVHLSSGGCVYALATHPARPTAVLRYRLDGDLAETVRRASDSSPDAAFLSEPKEVRFPTGPEGAAHAYANYYPPKSPTHQAPEGTLPPLVVMAHGGPTGQASTGLDLKKQFYTSRGFAVLDVNYRGSTGYGRKYRDALMGQFGVVDIDDCCQAARYAAQQGWADGSKLCIEGGSSGGYVVLCAALRPDLFAAAVSRYGISDMEELAKTTHKFEAPYNDSLIGPYPAKAELYRQRSPINHTDKICCPVAFFQGLDDAVVPPAQTTKMFAAVKAKGLPTALVEFQGEGHGFRKAENIRLALEGSFVFLCKVLRIPTKLSVPRDRMAILNLDERA